VDGDPDQPVVIGALYNAASPFPYPLPSRKSQSSLRSQSSPFMQGQFNELVLDDEWGKELVYLQGQRNFVKLVKNDATAQVGSDHLELVGQHRLGVIRKTDATFVGQSHLTQMVKAKGFKAADRGEPNVSAKRTWFELKNERITLTTGDATVLLDGPDITVRAAKGVRFSAGAELTLKGANLYLNRGAVEASDQHAEVAVRDEVRSIEERTDAAVLKLVHKAEKKKKLKLGWGFQVDNTVPQPASATGRMPGVALRDLAPAPAKEEQ